MEINNKKISQAIYSDNQSRVIFYYLSNQETEILVDNLTTALLGINDSVVSQEGLSVWLAQAKASVKNVINDLSAYWTNGYILNKIVVDNVLENLFKEDFGNLDFSWLEIEADKFFNVNSINSGEQLTEPKTFESVKYRAFKFIESVDLVGCNKLSERLGVIIENFPGSTEQEKNIVAIIKFWVWRLKIFAFRKLKLQEEQSVLKNNLITVLRYEFTLEDKLKEKLASYESAGVIEEQRMAFLAALNGNKALLPPNFNKQDFLPTISNWISEYQRVINQSSSVKIQPGTFHVLKFIDTNQYAKFLNQPEKDLLKRVLALYNWLLNPPINVSQTEIDSSQIDINDKKPEIPEELQKTDSVINLPPVVPAPKNAPQVVPMEEVSSSPAAVMPPLTVKKQGPVQGYVMGAKNSNIQDLLKSSAQDYESRGLRMGSNPSSLISDPLPKAQTNNPSSLNVNPLPGDAGIKKQNSKEQEINKKLEDLEKRIKK